MQGQQQQRRINAQQRRQHGTSPTAENRLSTSVSPPNNSKMPLQKTRQVTNAMPIPGPIYFLVREQAKSLVAIKELKDRVKNLEHVQEEVFEAVHELRLDSESRLLREASSSYPGLVSPNSAMYGTNRKSSVPQSNRLVEINVANNANRRFSDMTVPVNAVTTSSTSKKKEEFVKSGGENDPENKQDSGVDSDCQIQMSLNPAPQHVSGTSQGATSKPEVDGSVELMRVLDEIELKSLRMRIQIADQERLLTDSDVVTEDKTNLVHTCRSLQLQLRDVKKENETLRKRAELAERYVEKLTFDRSLMDSKMELVLTEKKQLESTIHELHKKFVKSQMTSVPKKAGGGVSFQPPIAEPLTVPLDKTDRPRSLEDSKSKMSSILKEKNVLELQRQLLAYILENEVLVTKVEEAEKARAVSVKESDISQAKLRRNIDKLVREKNEFGKLYDSKRRELDLARQDLTSARGKVGRLEKDLNALNQYSDMADGSDQFLGVGEIEPETTASFIDFTELSTKNKSNGCLSLPPVLYSSGGPNHRVLKDIFASNEAGYLDLSQESCEDDDNLFDVTTRKVKKYLPSPFLREGATASQTTTIRPSNVDLESICSEFDPLSQSAEDEKGSKVDFEDSLDVNVSPAKDLSRASSRATLGGASRPKIKYASTNQNVERYLALERKRVANRHREEPSNISQLLDLSIDEELL